MSAGEMVEREDVKKCPVCGTRFIGATPSDVWKHCPNECDPLGGLYVFSAKQDKNHE